MELGIPRGGWCPKGRKAEDGVIPDEYELTETTSSRYAQRTEWNVRDSDGTLILTVGPPTGGTALTRDLAIEQHKPVFVVDLEEDPEPAAAQAWLEDWGIGVLNVAGPRASKSAGVHDQALEFLRRALAR